MLNEKKDTQKIEKIIKNKRIFIISGNRSYIKSGAKKKIENLLKSNEYKVFYKKNDLPEYSEFVNLVKKIHEYKPDIIIGIGGGTSIDYAKLASISIRIKNLKVRIKKNLFSDIKKKIITIILPTTAGTGAEETSFATIFLNKKKYSVQHNLVKPNYYFIFPKFLKSTSKYIRASSGLDTICQSTESLLSKNSNSLSNKYAIESLKIAFKYFLLFVRKNDDKYAKQMSLASNLSGKAINISKTTGPHAISYYFSTYHGLSHGHAVSLTINSFLYFIFINKEEAITNFNLKNKFDILFKLTSSKNIKEFNIFLNNLIKNSNLEINFKKLKIDIKNKIKLVIKETNIERLGNSPIKLEKSDLYSIIINNELKNFYKINEY
jgi:alcohol dehydrogenase